MLVIIKKQMYRNRLIELASFTPDPALIGSKLRADVLSEDITQPSDDAKYVKARDLIRKMQELVSGLQKLKGDYSKSSNPDKQRQINTKINDKITQANKTLQQLKPEIDQINNEFKSEVEHGDKSKLIECSRVTREANEVISTFKNVQQLITEQLKSTLQRRAEMIQGEDISEKELENLINNPKKGQQMLREKLLDSPSVQLENYVSDIIDKCNDVQRLQRSMRECLRMMEDLADLVKLQGEKLTTIQQALDGAKDHIVKGDKALQSGKQLHKKSQKKMCCIMMILLTIIGIIVIPIVITKT